MTDQPQAPDDVMMMVRCKCTKGSLSLNCSCRCNNHAGVAVCVNFHGIACTNCDDKQMRTVSDVSHAAEEQSENFGLHDVIAGGEELDWRDEEIIDEVTAL